MISELKIAWHQIFCPQCRAANKTSSVYENFCERGKELFDEMVASSGVGQ